MARVVLMTVAAAALVLLLVLISSSYFIRSIVNPVVKLNALARKIAAGRYGERIEKEFDDEIGELCDTINYMSAEISRAEKVKNDFISSVSVSYTHLTDGSQHDVGASRADAGASGAYSAGDSWH